MANGQNVVLTAFPPAWNFQQLQMANIVLAIEGVYFPFFNEIEYSDSVDVEDGRGASPFPQGTTTGQYKATGSISVQLAMREQFLNIITGLSPDGDSVYDAVFNMQASWQHKSSPSQIQAPVFTDQILGCRLISSGITGSSGPGMMVVKYALNVQVVIHNGRKPLAGLSL